ncbi:riboflavin synthase [Parahaliea sp. F7430]|uniref:Riboflavin synthase n=1 Tax=Sediminihaliea albiluteola TaxID=2758564 RepID=A0A7W2YII3_9GAMM|nr:riboflavin synthase [Sediminihaliea albiluteola]MBA6411559.1 riboflavin synthase [Sediminihaliea albiluteola]
MFTGIIQAVGEVAALQNSGGDLRLRVRSAALPLDDVALGDSISTNGVCLTVTELPGDGYWADVSRETLDFTTLGSLVVGSRVNLEKALTPASRLGGHIVSGHVDGVGEVLSFTEDGRSIRFVLRAPEALAKYIAHKGSITVDGTSLTVNAVRGAEFDLNIIPQTMQETIFGTYTRGSRVNLEVDVIARYLERLMLGDAAADPQAEGLSMATLAENGYLRP